MPNSFILFSETQRLLLIPGIVGVRCSTSAYCHPQQSEGSLVWRKAR